MGQDGLMLSITIIQALQICSDIVNRFLMIGFVIKDCK